MFFMKVSKILVKIGDLSLNINVRCKTNNNIIIKTSFV